MTPIVPIAAAVALLFAVSSAGGTTTVSAERSQILNNAGLRVHIVHDEDALRQTLAVVNGPTDGSVQGHLIVLAAKDIILKQRAEGHTDLYGNHGKPYIIVRSTVPVYMCGFGTSLRGAERGVGIIDVVDTDFFGSGFSVMPDRYAHFTVNEAGDQRRTALKAAAYFPPTQGGYLFKGMQGEGYDISSTSVISSQCHRNNSTDTSGLTLGKSSAWYRFVNGAAVQDPSGWGTYDGYKPGNYDAGIALFCTSYEKAAKHKVFLQNVGAHGFMKYGIQVGLHGSPAGADDPGYVGPSVTLDGCSTHDNGEANLMWVSYHAASVRDHVARGSGAFDVTNERYVRANGTHVYWGDGGYGSGAGRHPYKGPMVMSNSEFTHNSRKGLDFHEMTDVKAVNCKFDGVGYGASFAVEEAQLVRRGGRSRDNQHAGLTFDNCTFRGFYAFDCDNGAFTESSTVNGETLEARMTSCVLNSCELRGVIGLKQAYTRFKVVINSGLIVPHVFGATDFNTSSSAGVYTGAANRRGSGAPLVLNDVEIRSSDAGNFAAAVMFAGDAVVTGSIIVDDRPFQHSDGATTSAQRVVNNPNMLRPGVAPKVTSGSPAGLVNVTVKVKRDNAAVQEQTIRVAGPTVEPSADVPEIRPYEFPAGVKIGYVKQSAQLPAINFAGGTINAVIEDLTPALTRPATGGESASALGIRSVKRVADLEGNWSLVDVRTAVVKDAFEALKITEPGDYFIKLSTPGGVYRIEVFR